MQRTKMEIYQVTLHQLINNCIICNYDECKKLPKDIYDNLRSVCTPDCSAELLNRDSLDIFIDRTFNVTVQIRVPETWAYYPRTIRMSNSKQKSWILPNLMRIKRLDHCYQGWLLSNCIDNECCHLSNYVRMNYVKLCQLRF